MENLKNLSQDELTQEIVKSSYKKLNTGRAVVREKLFPIYIIVLTAFFVVGIGLIIYGIVYRENEGAAMGYIGFLPIIVAACLIVFVFYRCYKIYDVYYFQAEGKRTVLYINKKYTIIYKSRNDFVCFNNKAKSVCEYDPDDFMNKKFGYNRMHGDMRSKKIKNGYKIQTVSPWKKKISRGTDKSVLWVDNDMNPKKILIGNKYIYKFINLDSFSLKLPEELLRLCAQDGIELPND